MKIKLKNELKDIKKRILDKYLSYKLDIKEEIGIQKIKEFGEVSFFRKIIKIVKIILISVGTISAFMTIISFFSKSDNSIAMDNYQRGMNYLEDKCYEEAEECFEIAYKKNSDLLELIYYYAYTQFVLGNFDKSYKILEENKNNLDDNEIVLLAMYEYRNGNYEKSQQYMDEIQEPEKLDIFAFCKYVDYTTKLGFLYDYDEGLNVVYNNSILLDAKLNVAGMLPKKEMEFYVVNGFEVDEEYLQETIDRIEYNSRIDKSHYVRTKLYMYLLFIYYSIQYENYGVPTRYFADIAETFDFANNSDITRQLMYVLYIYVSELKLYPEMPEEMKEAYNIVSEKYHQLESLEKENSIEIKEEDRKLFEVFERISKEMKDNTFNSDNYNFEWEAGFKYSEENVLKEWTRTMDEWVDYKSQ